tara:strand:- start:151 stop:273 length:123 start_codon:yes stop_codon:yes gene_type:complete
LNELIATARKVKAVSAINIAKTIGEISSSPKAIANKEFIE